MATSQEGMDITLIAGSDLTGAQFKFVELNTDGMVDVADGAGGPAIGVLQNNPDEGEAATVRVAGCTKVLSGEDSIEAGNRIQTDSDGTALEAASGDYVLAVALEGASDGDVFEILLVSQHINA